MPKQEKAAKKDKKAKVKAKKIVEEAVAKVAETGWASERAAGCTDEEFKLACEVRELRDAGEPWWRIGFILKLKGGADNVKDGKPGAHSARKAYAAGFGSHPRTQVRDGSRAIGREKNDTVRAVKEQTKRSRVAAVRSGKHVLGANLTDEEIVDAVKGRCIGWTIDTNQVGDNPAPLQEDHEFRYLEQEAHVHPDSVRVERLLDERVLIFREMHPKAAQEFRGVRANWRHVRLSRIHTVR